MNTGFDHLRVGIYRESFDPIHNGQVESAKAFMEQMKLDYLFVIPLYVDSASESDRALYRLRMCELAFEGVDGVIISDTDVKGEGKIGLADILRELSRPDTRLFWLCEADELLNFDQRSDMGEILSLCYPNYVRRENDPILTARIVEKITDIYNKHGKMFRRIVTEPRDILSSQIRRRVAEGKDVSGMVSTSVARFIKDNQLYLEDT